MDADAIQTAEMAAFVENFPRSLASVDEDDVERLVSMLDEGVGADLVSVRTASLVAKRMGSEALIKPQRLFKRLSLVLSLHFELEEVPSWADLEADPEVPRWLHKLSGEADGPPQAKDTVAMPTDIAWLPPTLPLHERLVALKKAAPTLQDMAARKRILDKVPAMGEVPRAPMCNAPNPPRSDANWRKVDDQVRDITRGLALLYSKTQDDPNLKDFDVSDPVEKWVENLFALGCALSYAITNIRLKDINPNLLPQTTEEALVLVQKDNMKILEERSRVDKTCNSGRGKGASSNSSFSQRYQPYEPAYGKGQGKNGKKGNATFFFQQGKAAGGK